MLPLEQGKGLVDQRQHVDAHGLALLLHLNGLVKLLNGLRVVLLVQEKLAIVVVHVGNILEVLDGSTEGGHCRSNGAHLVLCHTKLDVREDERTVQVNRLLVVLGGLGELAQDEVELSTVVVNVRLVLVVSDSSLEIVGSSILVT